MPREITNQTFQSRQPVIFFIISLFLVVLYEPLQSYGLNASKYIDEIICLILIVAACAKIALRGPIRLFPFEVAIIVICCILLVIGIWPYLGNPPNLYQAAFLDCIVFFKAIAVYFSIRVLWRHWNFLQWDRVFVPWQLGLVVIVGLLLIINKLNPVFPQMNVRFGFSSEQLFFSHPSRYAFFWQFCFVVFMPFFIPRRRWFLILLLIMGLFSLRFKYFAFVPLAVAAIIIGHGLKRIGFGDLRLIFLGTMFAVLVFVVGWNQVKLNFYSDSGRNGYARAELLSNSFVVAQKHFPIGSGFGTYGSYASAKYYSPIYYKLGMDRIYGLSPKRASFTADTYWPMVLAQFGYGGVVIMVGIFVSLIGGFVWFYNRTDVEKEKLLYLSALVLLAGLIIDSSSDAIFSQNRAVISFIYLALVINHGAMKAEEKYNENMSNQ